MAKAHAWEIQAKARVDWLRAELQQAAAVSGGTMQDGALVGANPTLRTAPDSAFAAVSARLDEAEGYLRPSRGGKAGSQDWLRGTRVEGAWTNIHSAHARLIEVAGADQVRALVTDVRSAVAAYLPDKDPTRKAIEAWKGSAKPLEPGDRELLSNALRQAYDANAERYTQLRRFRNILMGAAFVFLVFSGALAGLGVVSPQNIPLCFPLTAEDNSDGTDVPEEAGEAGDGTGSASGSKSRVPAVTKTAPPSAAKDVCPTGRDTASAGDVGLVLFLGFVGGALGGVRSLTTSTRATVTAYTLRVARMGLKVAMGGVTAVVGLLFLRAGFAPGFDGLDKQVEILAYALLFGSTQQLLTRMADRQAEVILKSASSEGDDTTDTP